MKLIKQSKLRYQQGKSDKVYEVALYEVGSDQYLVNFRYGRYGATLREGTKTTTPVSLNRAEQVFEKLVSSKTKKGYQVATVNSPSISTSTFNLDSRARIVLKRLQAAVEANTLEPQGNWSLTRVIWRAGELKIKEATPLLLNLLGKGNTLHNYCVVWSLGWCGNQETMPTLEQLYRDPNTPDSVRRISAEALLKLGDEAANATFRAELISQLPAELRTLAESGPATEFTTALMSYLKRNSPEQVAVLDTLYRIDNEYVRPALLEVLQTTPFQPNYFQAIRHIFKAAEYRQDGQVFGLIAYRIEKTASMFGQTYFPLSAESRWRRSVRLRNGRYIEDALNSIKSDSADLAYGYRTRTYFRRRVWRTLYKLGQLNDPAYVKMAVGVLAPYRDADANVTNSYFPGWDYRTRRYIRFYWNSYANYWAFNYILHENSQRYSPKYKPLAWHIRLKDTQTVPAPTQREEAFPQLWEQNPIGLLHLVAESACLPVHEFAVLALRDCPEFCASLDIEAVTMIVSRPYEVTAQLGFELAQPLYERYNPNHALVLAMANCVWAEARQQGHTWINDNRSHFIKDGDFVVAVVTSSYADTRAFARNLLRSALISDSAAQHLIARFVAYLLGWDSAQIETAQDVIQTVQDSFNRQLRRIGLEVVLDLLAHPLLVIQEFGATILLNHDQRANNLPEGVIRSLIESPHAPIRAVGMQLFGQLSDYTLRRQENLIISFAMHPLNDIRTAVRPVIQRLCRNDRRFSARLSTLFIEALYHPETSAGVHANLVALLREDVGSTWLDEATPQMVWLLLRADSGAAQELGGYILQTKIEQDSYWAQQITTEQIIELAEYEVVAVRQTAQTIFITVINRFRHTTNADHLTELATAVRLLDGKWDDTQQFWFETFRQRLTADDFTPGILVSICDSVRPDVQQFGRELITQYFEEAAGQEYLLKLSEHPTTDLQLFATNFLERYAADNPTRLAELRPYFISVLARVNKARVAKDRVLNFLTVEAQKSIESAEIVAQILTRQSLTMAIGDKAKTIEAMLAIQQQYPEIPLPIQMKALEVHHAV